MMRFLLIFCIKIYWYLIPVHRRKHCVFKKSCSNYVYEITQKQGIIKGLKALRYRFNNCRNTIEIFKNPVDKTIQVLLPSGDIIRENKVSNRIVKSFNNEVK